jgi:hypothetical protein
VYEISKANRENGGTWFSLAEMRIFDRRISEKVYPTPEGTYFVSSERYGEGSVRRFSVRLALPSGGISTAGELGVFKTLVSAQRAAARLAQKASVTGDGDAEWLKSVPREKTADEVEAAEQLRSGLRGPYVPHHHHAYHSESRH